MRASSRSPRRRRASSWCASRPRSPAAPTSRSSAAAATRACCAPRRASATRWPGAVAAVGRERRAAGGKAIASRSPTRRPAASARSAAPAASNLCPDLEYLNGAFADYLRVPPRFVERSVHRLPPELPAAAAALAEPLACVLHGIERLALAPGADVLVLGAGPIGLLFVAALHAAGHRAAAADPHPQRLAVAAALGAAATHAVERGAATEWRQLARDAAGFSAAVDAAGGTDSWDDRARQPAGGRPGVSVRRPAGGDAGRARPPRPALPGARRDRRLPLPPDGLRRGPRAPALRPRRGALADHRRAAARRARGSAEVYDAAGGPEGPDSSLKGGFPCR